MMGNKSLVFRFSDIEVREREFSLLKAGKVLAVEPKAFRVLLLLVRTPQKVISKEELLNSVWGDTAVTEGSLTRCMWLLRRLLGDDVNEPRFIETVATVGYRLVCKVEVSEIAMGDVQATGKEIGLSEADFVETSVQSVRDLSREVKWVPAEVNLTKASEPADGSGKLERLAESDFLVPNDWSADGRFLVYMNFQNGIAPELDVLDLRNHSQTTYATGGEAQFSPDGKWIAFTGLRSSGSGEGSEVYVGRFPGPGRRIQISSHGGAQARWRADGKELFYITIDKNLMAVAIDTSHGEPVAGVPHVLFQTRIIAPRIVLFQYAVSPDGSRFLINSMPSVGAAPDGADELSCMRPT
jgi:DNA-binding winged helix-turn-helix (wHTH) protein